MSGSAAAATRRAPAAHMGLGGTNVQWYFSSFGYRFSPGRAKNDSQRVYFVIISPYADGTYVGGLEGECPPRTPTLLHQARATPAPGGAKGFLGRRCLPKPLFA